MGWWNKTAASKKQHKNDMRYRDYEVVDAYLYDRPGQKSDLPEPRQRRFDTQGRVSYR